MSQEIIAKLTGNIIMASPSGSNGQIQFNKNGVFGGFGSYDEENNELTLSILKLTGEITEESQAITLGYLNTTPAGGISALDVENWDTAFGWGDHAGIYDALGEADSVLEAHNLEYDHSLIETALQSETDPVFTAWDKSTGISITESQISDLKTYIQSSEKGANNGVATLDAGGKVPSTQLPATLLIYKGVWDADTNTPELTTPDITKKGFVYNVSVAGTKFGISFSLGDWAIYNDDGVLEKSDNSDDVTSVNGQQGAVVLNADHISDSTTTNKFVTTAEKGVWNGKQDALGYTPENAVNKKTTLTDSDTDYPTTRAVNTALNAKVSWGGDSLASKGLIGTTSNQPFGIITNNTEKVTVLANGFVGIGTTAPDNVLTVKGSNALVDIQSSADGQLIGFLARYRNHDTLGCRFLYSTGTATLSIDNLFTGNNANHSDIYFRNADTGGNLKTRVTIKGSTGNVGIGTTAPGKQLSVVGNIESLITLGSELITNGTFDSALTGWTNGSMNTFVWDSGSMHIVQTGTGWPSVYTTVPLTPGNIYYYSIDVTVNSGSFLFLQQGPNTTIAELSTSNSFSGYFIASSDSANTIRLKGSNAPGDWNIDNISIQPYISGGMTTPFLAVNDSDLFAGYGKVGIGTSAPTAKLDVASDILRLRTAKTPASSGASGNTGDYCWDADYLYICVNTNTWRRVAHDTW